MKHTIQIALVLGACLVSWLGPSPVLAQACKDEEMMTSESKKTLVDVVEMVKKESLTDFKKAYHRNSCLNKLTFSLTAVNGLVSCLDKAVQDTTATKEDIDAYKAKREASAKLKEKMEEDRKALKAASDAEGAKGVIEKFNYSN
jgi:hypothetical protein